VFAPNRIVRAVNVPPPEDSEIVTLPAAELADVQRNEIGAAAIVGAASVKT
jgi:hypothetical protein